MTAKQTSLQLAVLLLLLGCACGVNYQAAGNFTTSNVLVIWNTIQNALPTYVTASNTNLSKLSTFLSNSYNTAFGPTWNVFVFENFNSSVEAIFCGFAYQNQWMWLNNYTYLGRSFTFVIWRENNCVTWHTLDNTAVKPITSSLTSAAPNYALQQSVSKALDILQASNAFPANAYEDVWTHTNLLLKKMQELNPKKTYTIVAVQNLFSTTSDKANSMNGQFCSNGGDATFLFTRVGRMSSSTGFEGLHKILVIETKSS